VTCIRLWIDASRPNRGIIGKTRVALLQDMDWLTFLIRLIEAIAVPVAAVIIVLVFRREFRQLVPLVRKLKAGPLEAEFEREVREIAQEAGGTTTPEIEGEPDPRKITLIELARLHPRSAILEAWLGVETAVMRAALQKATGSPVPDVSSPIKALRELVRAEAISPEDVALFHDLRGLRNQAVHFDVFEPSQGAALEYVDLASQLQSRLERLADLSS
jgi:hypothetical protein